MIAISLARIYVNNVAPISVYACLVHSDKLHTITTLIHSMHIYYAESMVLTGNSMGIAVKFGIYKIPLLLYWKW